MGGPLAAAAGLDVAVGWVPVAGQVVVIGTGVFLAGDWTYHHWDEVKGWGKNVGHLGSELGSGAVDAGKDVVGAVGGFLGL